MERGLRPLNQTDAAIGLRAASTGQSSIGEPNQSIVGDFVRNVQEFAGGLPRLPLALGNEILDLPQAPQQIREGLNRASNPLEALGNVAQAPGARLVPGAFVAGQFGTGGPGVQGVLDDPLFSLLDVLPYASKAAELSPGARAAQAAVDAAGTGERVGKFSSAVRYTGKPRTTEVSPRVTTSRGATVREALEPTRVGLAMENAGAAIRGTRPGDTIARAFGANAMSATQSAARIEAELNVSKYARNADDAALIDTHAAAQNADRAARAAGISDARKAQLAQELPLGTLDESTLPASERAYITEYRRLNKAALDQDIAEGRLVEMDIPTPGGGVTREVFRADEAKKILAARRRRSHAAILDDARQVASSDVTVTGADLVSRLRDLADSDMPLRQKRRAARAYIAGAEAQGLDVSRVGLRANNKAALDASLRSITPPASTTTRASLTDIRRSIMPMSRTDTTVSRLVGFIDSGDMSRAAQTARRISARSKFTGGMNWGDIADDLTAYARRDRAAASLAAENPERLLRNAEKSVRSLEAAAAPARFNDVIGREIADRIGGTQANRLGGEIAKLQQAGALTPEQAADAARLLMDGMLQRDLFPEPLRPIIRATSEEVRRTWLDMVDAGLDPTFVHRVRSSRAGASVRVTGQPSTIGHVRERVFDFGSSVNDIMVAVDHQAAEILMRRGYERYMNEIADTFGRSFDELQYRYREWAERASQRNPRVNTRNHLDNLMNRDWREVSIPEATIDGQLRPARKVWIPRDLAGTIDKLAPSDLGFLGKTLDPVMRVFRTALLPFSPRWHMYNVLGGAIMLTSEAGLGAWKHMGEAWKIATGKIDTPFTDVRGMPQIAGGVEGRALREATQWGRTTDLSTKSGRAVGIWEHSTGRFLRRIWDEAGWGADESGRRGFMARMEDRSYAINEMFDDMYRSMAYLHGTDKALTRGLTREAAEAAGVQASRRILQSWDRLTPVERTVVRNIFPFYSWAKHLLGYVTRFPFDHPLRTSVTASLIQAELDDYGTGLPQMFFSLIDVTGIANRLGYDPGEGQKVMLNLEGANPFRDIGSYASLLGFMAAPLTGEAGSVGSLGSVTAQMNPAAQVFLRAAGIDPAEGLPDLYGDVSYDPATGGLRVSTSFNPLFDIPQAIIPQTRIAFDLAGVNRDFQNLLRYNPDAAVRRLVSSAGVPVMWRSQFDPQSEIIKAEVRRYEDVQRTRSEALRSGDLSQLGRYDILSDYRANLEAARERGDLDAFTPPSREDIDRQIRDAERRSPLNN